MPSGVKDIQLLELKDTISQLNKTISTQNELISSLQKMLEERNAKDSEKDLLIANLQSQLAYLKNKVFGSTSEIRHDQLDGQLNLFGTPVGDEKPAEVIEPEVISVKGYTKERKPKATYDDKYNSVRSICKHFFTDIVGLSIKFFCVSLRHMSIGCRVILPVTFQQVHAAPHTEGTAEADHDSLQSINCAIEKFHTFTSINSDCDVVLGTKKLPVISSSTSQSAGGPELLAVQPFQHGKRVNFAPCFQHFAVCLCHQLFYFGVSRHYETMIEQPPRSKGGASDISIDFFLRIEIVRKCQFVRVFHRVRLLSMPAALFGGHIFIRQVNVVQLKGFRL